MCAGRNFTEMSDGERLAIGATRISACELNHPGGCLGVRLETSSGSIVYATDYEPGLREFDAGLRELARGADLLIADAQYAPEQLAGARKGWGHSSWLDSVRVAQDAGAKNLVLFHHDPDSADKTVDGFLRQARRNFENVWGAAEGMEIAIAGQRVEVHAHEAPLLTPA